MIGGQTLNYYNRDLRAFCRWMAKDGRAQSVALATLTKVKNAAVDADQRRAITVDEMRLLVASAANSSRSRCGLSGDERALLYPFTFETGMRPGQIRP